MIFLYDKTNQMCNRLWSIIPVIAQALEKEEKVYIFFFNEYIDLLETTKRHPNIVFINLLSFMSLNTYNKTASILKKIFNHFFKGHQDLYSNYKIKFINGWKYRNSLKFIDNNADKIREILKISKNTTKPIDYLFNQIRQNTDIIIGVHMRRGDYVEWLNGRYYFDLDTYKKFMSEIKDQITDSRKNVKFLLCTNEPFDSKVFKDFDYFIIPESSSYKDLYALSKSDYIIGPPSSYSQYASFMGRVPLKLVKDKNERIYLKDFSNIVTLDIFENGNILVV